MRRTLAYCACSLVLVLLAVWPAVIGRGPRRPGAPGQGRELCGGAGRRAPERALHPHLHRAGERPRPDHARWGPFPTPHTIVSASGEGPDGAFTVNLTGGARVLSGQFRALHARGPAVQVMVRYTVDRSVFDPTTVKGQPYAPSAGRRSSGRCPSAPRDHLYPAHRAARRASPSPSR